MSINIRNLTHVYLSRSENVVALNGMNLDVPNGQICVIRGPNGSGKSTLIEILASNLTATAGSISTSFGEVTTPKIRVIRQFDSAMNSFTVGEFIDTICHINNISPADFGQDIPLTQKLSSMSPGSRQKLAISLALATSPDILLADEPTAALNREQSLDVYEHLAASCRTLGITLLLVTHDFRAEEFADRVVRIRDGRISEEWEPGGPERQVVDSHGWLRLPQNIAERAQPSLTSTISQDHVRLEGFKAAKVETSQPAAQERHLEKSCLSLANIWLSYPPETQVFTGQSFEFYEGAFNVVLGPSGSGKTSLFMVAAGLHQPESGTIVIENNERHFPNAHQVSTTSQHQIALFGNELDLGQAQTLIDFGVKAELIEALELNELQHRKLHSLSGGQRQRANAAIALNHSAMTLLLDEPTSSLDSHNRDLLIRVLQSEIEKGRTIIVATHDEEVASYADHLISLA